MALSKIIIIAIFMILPFSNFAQQGVKFEKTYTEVCFSNNLNIQDLSQIQTVLSEKGIHLNYNYLKFGEDDKLAAIKYHVISGKVFAIDESYEPVFEIGFIINTEPQKKYDIIAGTKQQIEKRRVELEMKN